MKKIKRKTSEKIDKDIIVIVVNTTNIIIAKITNNIVLNLGLEGYTFILH